MFNTIIEHIILYLENEAQFYQQVMKVTNRRDLTQLVKELLDTNNITIVPIPSWLEEDYQAIAYPSLRAIALSPYAEPIIENHLILHEVVHVLQNDKGRACFEAKSEFIAEMVACLISGDVSYTAQYLGTYIPDAEKIKRLAKSQRPTIERLVNYLSMVPV